MVPSFFGRDQDRWSDFGGILAVRIHRIPYSDAKIMPESTSAKSYICEEYNDMICMWYHAEGVSVILPLT